MTALKALKKLISSKKYRTILVFSIIGIIIASSLVVTHKNALDYANKSSQVIVIVEPENSGDMIWTTIDWYDANNAKIDLAYFTDYQGLYRADFALYSSVTEINGTRFVLDTPGPATVYANPVSSDFKVMSFWSTTFPFQSWVESPDLAHAAAKYHITYDHIEYDIWIVLR